MQAGRVHHDELETVSIYEFGEAWGPPEGEELLLAMEARDRAQWQAKLDLDRRYQEETQMALVKDMIQSKYLRKEDIDDDTVYTIRGVRQDNLAKEDQPAEMRWVMGFKEQPKPMVLNITSIRVLEQAYGGDTDHWIGNEVIVYVDPNVSFGGKVVGGLRLRIPKKKADPKAAAAQAKAFDNDLDDSAIPF
jgi:hypothetical protein